MTRRLTRDGHQGGLALLLLLLAFCTFLLIRHAQRAPMDPPSAFPAPILKVVPEATGVTFSFSSAVGSLLPAGVPLRVVIATPAGPLQRLALSQPGRTDLRIAYVRAGLTVYDATVGPYSYHGQWQRAPGPAQSPLRLKVGARAVRVTGDPPPALVLHPLDAQNNVSDQAVTIEARGPDGFLWKRPLPVHHLLGWTFLPVGTRTGTLEVTARVGQAHGERAEVDLLPGPAAQARLAARRSSAPASGRDAWQLDVSDLQDRLGNRILDGTSVSVESGGPLNFSVTRPSTGGNVLLEWPAAARPGRYRMTGHSGDATSPGVTLTSVRPLDLPALPVRRSGTTLIVGPVLTDLGAFPDDGTPVTLHFLSSKGQLVREDTTFLTAGEARYTVPALPPGTDQAEVWLGGQVSRLRLGRP